MVERDFDGAKGPEPVGPPGGDPRLVVEAFDGATGPRPFGPEPIEQERPVGAEHTGDLLHRLEPGAQRPGAPPVQEPPRPVGRDVVPEELEIFRQEIRPDHQVTSTRPTLGISRGRRPSAAFRTWTAPFQTTLLRPRSSSCSLLVRGAETVNSEARDTRLSAHFPGGYFVPTPIRYVCGTMNSSAPSNWRRAASIAAQAAVRSASAACISSCGTSGSRSRTFCTATARDGNRRWTGAASTATSRNPASW